MTDLILLSQAQMRRIYGASTVDQAAAKLDAFEEKRAGKYASHCSGLAPEHGKR